MLPPQRAAPTPNSNIGDISSNYEQISTTFGLGIQDLNCGIN